MQQKGWYDYSYMHMVFLLPWLHGRISLRFSIDNSFSFCSSSMYLIHPLKSYKTHTPYLHTVSHYNDLYMKLCHKHKMAANSGGTLISSSTDAYVNGHISAEKKDMELQPAGMVIRHYNKSHLSILFLIIDFNYSVS